MATMTEATPLSATKPLSAMAPRLRRASAHPRSEAGRGVPRWLRALLAVPLLGKLAGAAGVIVLAMATITIVLHGADARDREMMALIFVALFASLAVNLVLVTIALKPLAELENIAGRVLAGDLEARVTPSLLADRDIARLGRSINLLLDSLVADRTRMRELASHCVRVQDEERALVAHELHESAAQALSAQMLHLAAVARDTTDPAVSERLQAIRDTMGATLEEIRALSQAMHPQVLDDLGIAAAIARLAREARERYQARIDVMVDAGVSRASPAVASVLYRVAQEAIANAMRHGAAGRVRVDLTTAQDTATLEVEDDGTGFDVSAAEATRPSTGLFAMRERVSLVHGRLSIQSEPGRGTRIVATVPIE